MASTSPTPTQYFNGEVVRCLVSRQQVRSLFASLCFEKIHHQVLPLPWIKMERKKERECITMIPPRWSWNPSWRLALAFFLQTHLWRANRNQIHGKSRRKPYWFFLSSPCVSQVSDFVIKAMIHQKTLAFQEVAEKNFRHGLTNSEANSKEGSLTWFVHPEHQGKFFEKIVSIEKRIKQGNQGE